MNLNGIMKTLGAQMGEVVSNPYARAFAPQPSVKEEVVNEEDHEVSMAQNQLDSIIKNANELKGKIGEMEKNIPGWIQDHITNSENYIEQANTGYHELEESLNEEFKHIIHVDTPTQVVSKPIAAQILALAKKGVRSKDIGLEMGFVGNQKLATDAFQKVKNKIYFELGKKNESVNEAVDFRDGKYRFYSKDGVGYLTYDGKELSSGDFDWEDGSNSYWMSHSSFKGSQKAFDTGKDVINYFKSKKITTESVNEVSYNVKANNAYEFINGAVAVLGMYLRDEKLESGVKNTLQRVVKDLEGLRKYFFSRKDESVNEGRGVKSLAKELFAVAEQIQGYVEVYKKKKGTPDEKKIVDILKKLNAEKKELEKRMEAEVSSLYRDAELQIEGTNTLRLKNIK